MSELAYARCRHCGTRDEVDIIEGRKCDNCEREASYTDNLRRGVKGWVNIPKPGVGVAPPGESRLDFCSYQCLSEWAARQVDEVDVAGVVEHAGS